MGVLQLLSYGKCFQNQASRAQGFTGTGCMLQAVSEIWG